MEKDIILIGDFNSHIESKDKDIRIPRRQVRTEVKDLKYVDNTI